MKKIAYLFLSLLIVACSNKKNDLTVKVEVDGLKKGVLYLKKIKNNNFITIDTVAVNGQSEILLHAASLESPEVFYLFLDKKSAEKDQIQFFADKGVTEIKTSVRNFGYGMTINGSKQQKVFEEYKLMKSRFNEQTLDLIKENFDALKINDTSKLRAIQKQSDNNLKRRYLFTVNFALNNKDSEVAPYLALNEIYNAKFNLLDTINTSLTPQVKASKYGKELQLYIDKIKLEEE